MSLRKILGRTRLDAKMGLGYQNNASRQKIKRNPIFQAIGHLKAEEKSPFKILKLKLDTLRVNCHAITGFSKGHSNDI